MLEYKKVSKLKSIANAFEIKGFIVLKNEIISRTRLDTTSKDFKNIGV